MKKENNQHGFTLIEVIVAIVISGIALTLVSYFFVTFMRTSKEVKAQQQRTYEQNLIVNYFDGFANRVNLKGINIQINYEQGLAYAGDLEEESTRYETIQIDNVNKIFTYNDVTLNYSSIVDIQLVEIEGSSKCFSVWITFDDDSTYQFAIYIIAGIKEE